MTNTLNDHPPTEQWNPGPPALGLLPPPAPALGRPTPPGRPDSLPTDTGGSEGRRPRTTLRAAFAGGVVGAAVAAAVAFGVVDNHDRTVPVLPVPAASGAIPTGGASSVAPGSLEVHALIAKVEPAVVDIEVGATAADGSVQAIAAGSGVVISADGLVLTNAHVVQLTDPSGQTIDNPVFTMKMNDGSVRSAKVLGASPDYDVALMRLDDTSNLSPIELGDSASARVGDEVVAIGNALNLGDVPTVSRGIISALERTLAVDATTTLHGLIQTDAPINHGNSGGALVDSAGRLIGINSAGIPDSQNIGFAIAINTIKPLLDDLKAGRTVKAEPISYLGVTVDQSPTGVTVTDLLSDGPAHTAGMRAGDVIAKIGDATINTTEQLSSTLQKLRPGTKTTVEVTRNGTTQTVDIVLGTRPTG